jgi:pilus assembly protein Flp/PilA
LDRILKYSAASVFEYAGAAKLPGEPGVKLAKKGGTPMKKFMLRKGQKGQGLVEYSLIIALVAIVVIAILVLMGPQIGNIFSTITHGL